ncbi:tyrosyl-DNA phosphodiesterase I [Halteromyces radiatus]|uniref:tyrosyl-DNA phosphodiesterase I n=1 Tax=Halteromyces radiatus TaxID=101107 RepID=UPI00221E90EB|nr:tyrosyl-DNA phosphodiesterase I [Halteromyces radiatus]KAI8099966.1 tyrosyl-DNA phosphodiesterase I [Halteromyces radiatus]
MTSIQPGISLFTSPHVHPEENVDTVSLYDLLYHEDLEYIVQMNFLVDLTYLMSHLHPNFKNGNVPLVVVYGHTDPDIARQITKDYSWVQLVEPHLKDRYGSHHTKAMILFFNTNGIQTAQIVIMTANMVQDDWERMTQGLYRTPRCQLKINSTSSSYSPAGSLQGMEFESPFARDMINYLHGYNLPVLNEVAQRLRYYDWSPCKAILIGSIPGRHKAQDLKKWGMLRLAQVLQDHVHLPEQCCHESSIVIQCSSIANMTERFIHSFEQCLSAANNAKDANHAKIRLVYPTMETVAESCTGLLDSGGFLRLDEDVYKKNQAWFEEHMVEWASYTVGRQYLMPHIKTYTRIYHDTITDKYALAWFLLTSHNLSRAAWGDQQVNGTQLYIKSYELGVLICPSLWETNQDPYIEMMPSTLFDPSPSNLPGIPVVPIRLPYDLPLHKHSSPCFVRRPYY